jgi:selenocysteine lyase/cysteine desulfurase
VSFATATVAWNLRVRANEIVGGRRRILGVAGQFPSNVQTWKLLEEHGFRFDLLPGGEGATARLLEALDGDTALVAIEPLSWTDGLRLDLAALLPRIREAGALSLLDVTQCIGADDPIPEDLPADIVTGAGYKWLLGPYGTGYMRLSPALQERLEPLEWNWKNFAGSRDFNRLTEYRHDFAGPEAKFDHGESSAFLRLAAWEAGLAFLRELGPLTVRRHALAFARAVRSGLDRERFEVSDVESPGQAAHLFRVAPRDPERFDTLSDDLTDAGVLVSRRAGGWRLSPHVYNDERDLERLLSILS